MRGATDAPRGNARALSPQGAQAIARVHHGVARVHGGAIGVWLLVAGGSGMLLLTGVAIPAFVPIGSLLAAVIHGLLLFLHSALGRRALRRASDASEPPPRAK